MSLVDERNGWRTSFENGEEVYMPILEKYRECRDSESWRTSRICERMCEYILHLEEQLRIQKIETEAAQSEASIFKLVCGVEEP